MVISNDATKTSKRSHQRNYSNISACISPILEYAAPVFHNSLPKYLSFEIERVQKRCLRRIFRRELRKQSNYLIHQLSKVKLEVDKMSFKYTGAKYYNDLPLEIKSIVSFKTFKEKLHKHLFETE